MPALDEILAVILGGGRGSRLYPLTQQRSKPAVPMAGKYRLIDIPISNCINSNIYRIAVLTQFNSVSLHRHIAQTFIFDIFHSGWVQVWAAEQTMEHTDWYQGTADAVRKQILQIRSTRAKYVLILAGDHLYRMDYSKMAQFHWDNKAEITVAVQPVRRAEAPRLGILKREADKRISTFSEKPKDPQLLDRLVSRDDPERPFLGSMGIYLFNSDTLIDILHHSTADDFGGQIIPQAIPNYKVYGFDFDGYWQDIGTIRSFYETNLALTQPDPAFNFFDPKNPIYCHPRFLPCSTIENSELKNVLMAEGCCIRNSRVSNSVVGLRCQVHSGTYINRCVIMGSDYYETSCWEENCDEGEYISIGIGRDCHLEGAIIDKNARIGRGVIIHPFPRGTDLDGANWVVQDGVVVIPKNAVIPPGTIITP